MTLGKPEVTEGALGGEQAGRALPSPSPGNRCGFHRRCEAASRLDPPPRLLLIPPLWPLTHRKCPLFQEHLSPHPPSHRARCRNLTPHGCCAGPRPRVPHTQPESAGCCHPARAGNARLRPRCNNLDCTPGAIRCVKRAYIYRKQKEPSSLGVLIANYTRKQNSWVVNIKIFFTKLYLILKLLSTKFKSSNKYLADLT